MSWFRNIADLYYGVSAHISAMNSAMRCAACGGYICNLVALCQKWGGGGGGGGTAFNEAMRLAAENGHIEIVKLCKECGATDFDEAMRLAAENGHIEIVKLCREYGATDFDEAMYEAACGGHIEIVKLCREYGATDFDEAMREAVCNGHIEIVKLCREYGATDFDEAMYEAACEGHVDIFKLFRDWIGFEAIHHDLLRHHHKREFSRRIHNELLPIAWHPNRFWDWCVCEEEKVFLEEMWKV